MANITAIEGIGDAYAAKLAEVGIKTTDELLASANTSNARKNLAAVSGIDAARILAWANRADLFRIKGIGEEYSDLLEAAGVDTVPELTQRKAENLQAKLAETNAAKKLVRRVPTLSQVSDWIEQAKGLPRVIEY